MTSASDSSDFSVQAESKDGRVVLTVSGELDLAAAPRLRLHCDEALAGDAVSLAIDLRPCGFVDSTGIASLVRVARKCDEADLPFALVVAPDSQPSRLFKLTGLDRRIRVAASLTAALESHDQG